jgi:hypothetical protein
MPNEPGLIFGTLRVVLRHGTAVELREAFGVQLAGAIARQGWSESGSKLRTLQTLRAAGHLHRVAMVPPPVRKNSVLRLVNAQF